MDTNTQYKGRLSEMYADIVTELETIAVHNPDTDDWEVTTEIRDTDDADENLQADAAEEATSRLATLAALETRYRSIKRALEKIEAGTFGICEIAHEAIEADRLEANPAARTCKAHMNEESQLPL